MRYFSSSGKLFADYGLGYAPVGLGSVNSARAAGKKAGKKINNDCVKNCSSSAVIYDLTNQSATQSEIEAFENGCNSTCKESTSGSVLDSIAASSKATNITPGARTVSSEVSETPISSRARYQR